MIYLFDILSNCCNFVIMAVAVVGKNIWGPGPSSFGRLSKITIEPINSTSCRTTLSKNFGGLGKIWGACAPLAPT